MKIRFFISIFSVLLACSCSKLELAGIVDRINLNVPGDFTSISVDGAIDVSFSDDCTSVQVETDVNLLPYVEVYLDGRQLKVRLSSEIKISPDYNSRITVMIPYRQGVNSISLDGASSFVSDYPVKGKDVVIVASGASEIICHVIAERSATISLSGASLAEFGSLSSELLNLEMSGASSLQASGRVSSGQISLSGASELKGIVSVQKYSFDIDSCYGTLVGASKAVFKSDGLISCNLYGASRICYIGNADMSGSRCYAASEIIKEKLTIN